MRIAITTVRVPFISGGAEMLADGLARAVRAAGHQVEVLATPFRFAPASEVLRSMAFWRDEDFERFDCGPIDTVIALKFPTYLLRHPQKIVWLMHQHRAVYELFDTPFGLSSADPESASLRASIVEADTRSLHDASHRYTISARVCERLLNHNGLHSEPLYHPPPNAEAHYCGEQLPYIFFPSRLEDLKRQDLLVRAMQRVRSPVTAVLCGAGGKEQSLRRLIAESGLQSKVRLLDRVTSSEMTVWYANALAVFFGPFDEDYGYVTLEAMLSSKPVITCNDSGGPLEFVVHGHTGLVVAPTSDAVADAIDALYANGRRAMEMGRAGRARYESLRIGWEHVVDVLLRPAPDLAPTVVGASVVSRTGSA